MRLPRPATVLAFGLGSLLVPAIELSLFRLTGRNPVNPTAPRTPRRKP